MLKAGALYFAIVMAFFIAVISAAIILLAAHYRNSYLKELRFNRLQQNRDSAILYALNTPAPVAGDTLKIDLYADEMDSVEINRESWGILNLTQVKAFIEQDTLKSIFFTGTDTHKDSLSLYLSDEDRPLSVSGKTKIVGDVQVPKAGVRQSYAEGKPYEGDQLIYGKISDSKRTLDALDEALIKKLTTHLELPLDALPVYPRQNLLVSFGQASRAYKLPVNTQLTQHLVGKIILYADTTVTITAQSQLNGVIIYAPAIMVEEGFEGNCQLFATDSIIVAPKVKLQYPSVLGLIASEKTVDQAKISIGKGSLVKGMVFSSEKKRSAMQTLIALGEKTRVVGEVYSTGLVKLGKETQIIGKVSCNRFMMQTPATLYENFLIDVRIDRKARSKYYLSSKLFKTEQAQNRILQWLN
ncbi:hypothetical protein [Pedobacter rhizosphaerae]|uniref:Uncharacterized protein n=1 Tax=Pedobacter rhizosphaerae TaxID=390241 RepID=A0A1H9VFD5_9SPHI|nr:hypothetical protein [Pedobacter rhizosphaerae]SES20184.1 hypothetical protein SAMN04488023_14214 [Pedobacter rhizosphaerae]